MPKFHIEYLGLNLTENVESVTHVRVLWVSGGRPIIFGSIGLGLISSCAGRDRVIKLGLVSVSYGE